MNVGVCVMYFIDQIGKRQPPWGTNSDRMTLAALSHGLLSCDERLQTKTFSASHTHAKGFFFLIV
jgi:hypothetical protein